MARNRPKSEFIQEMHRPRNTVLSLEIIQNVGTKNLGQSRSSVHVFEKNLADVRNCMPFMINSTMKTTIEVQLGIVGVDVGDGDWDDIRGG